MLTSDHGARALAARLPERCTLLVAGDDTAVDVPAAMRMLHERGLRLVVSEAGPHLFGSLLAEDLVDELFLNQSPLLAGRGPTGRLGLVDGAALLPDLHRTARLLSVRRLTDHLFLRYEMRRQNEVLLPGTRRL